MFENPPPTQENSLPATTTSSVQENVQSLPEAQVQSLATIEDLKDTRDVLSTKQLVKAHLKAGGSLNTLRQAFANAPTEATQQRPFNPEVNQAIQREMERRQFLETHRRTLTTSEDRAQLRPLLQEYSSIYETTIDELITELTADLSQPQSELLQQLSAENEKNSIEQRIHSWLVLKEQLSPAEIAELQNAVKNHPNIIDSLPLTPEMKAQLVNTQPDTTSDSAANQIDKYQKMLEAQSGWNGVDYMMMGLSIMLSPRAFDQAFNELTRTRLTIPLMQRLGMDAVFIENFTTKNRRSSREFLRLPSSKLLSLLKTFDRSRTLQFLEELDKESRISLVSGTDRHQFSKDERQTLFYSFDKLTKGDCEYLGIPTEAK